MSLDSISEGLMTVRKMKHLFNHKHSESRYVLHSLNEHYRIKHRANNSLRVSIFALFLLVLVLLVIYMVLNDTFDQIDPTPAIDIILTPQDLRSIR